MSCQQPLTAGHIRTTEQLQIKDNGNGFAIHILLYEPAIAGVRAAVGAMSVYCDALVVCCLSWSHLSGCLARLSSRDSRQSCLQLQLPPMSKHRLSGYTVEYASLAHTANIYIPLPSSHVSDRSDPPTAVLSMTGRRLLRWVGNVKVQHSSMRIARSPDSTYQ